MPNQFISSDHQFVPRAPRLHPKPTPNIYVPPLGIEKMTIIRMATEINQRNCLRYSNNTRQK